MQHQNTLEPSLQMRGQSPVNCPDSDVKEWGQNINLCLGTNDRSALFHFLDVVNECKGNNKILIYNTMNCFLKCQLFFPQMKPNNAKSHPISEISTSKSPSKKKDW